MVSRARELSAQRSARIARLKFPPVRNDGTSARNAALLARIDALTAAIDEELAKLSEALKESDSERE